MTRVHAVLCGCAVNCRGSRVAERVRHVGDADPRLVVEGSVRHHGVVELERGQVLALGKQARGAALGISKAHHVHTLLYNVPRGAHVKKCRRCTKSLPDAALQCIYCGTQQPSVPAVAPGVAKTVMMGYSGAPEPEPPRKRGGVSTASPNAATMMVAAAPSSPQPRQAPRRSAVDVLNAMQPTLHLSAADQTSPTGQSAYRRLAAARANRPIDPWRGALRSIMIVWGILLLVAFATPLSIDPLQFNWDAIIHRTGVAEIPLLLIAAVGFLGLAVALIPMPTLARGILAALFGLAGIVTPIVLVGQVPPWMVIAPMAGVLVTIASLVVRNEYTESLSARILITLGVIAMLVPWLVPQGSGIPLIALIKGLIHGDAATQQIVAVITIALALLSLMAWLPGPATGGAALFAWLLLLLPMVAHILAVVLDGNIDNVVKTPHAMLAVWIPASGYLVFASYGLATVYGKVLE